MMRVIIYSFEVRLSRSATIILPRFLGSRSKAEKVGQIAKEKIKWERLEQKARVLIFGEKKYINMSSREQKIVDWYQEQKLQEDAVVLPNTREDLEQAAAEQMMLEQYRKDQSLDRTRKDAALLQLKKETK